MQVPAFNFQFSWWTGGAHGFQDAQQGGTLFPMPLALAATFDAPLMERVASAIGDEARGRANAVYQREGRIA